MLKEIAAKLVPHDVVYRQKVGFPLPVADYLAPLARPEFFENGFCLEVLEMQRQGFLDAITNWQANVHGFFNLLAIEIWGRIFFMEQPVENVTEDLLRLPRRRHGSAQVTQPT
jgi:asparagine synthase (glutamine-hydrolysing)